MRAARAETEAARKQATAAEARLVEHAPLCGPCGARGARVCVVFKRCGHLGACSDCRAAGRAPCCPICAQKGQNFKDAFEVRW